MKLKMYQVDAFTSRLFGGNPAAVCPLDEWISDELLQNIAMENNLAETAFYVKKGSQYEIRWLTPAVEVDLCGHATLAAAYVLFYHENHEGDEVQFFSPRSGQLPVKKTGNLLTLNFPTDTLSQVSITNELTAGFNHKPIEVWKGKTDYMLVFANEEQVKTLSPDFGLVNKVKARGIIATAKGTQVDFVSRFFAPQSGINEDPVTGSAHTTLTPYWAEKLDKQTLTAEQISPRKGYLQCTLLGDRVEIGGEGRLYLIGDIFVK